MVQKNRQQQQIYVKNCTNINIESGLIQYFIYFISNCTVDHYWNSFNQSLLLEVVAYWRKSIWLCITCNVKLGNFVIKQPLQKSEWIKTVPIWSIVEFEGEWIKWVWIKPNAFLPVILSRTWWWGRGIRCIWMRDTVLWLRMLSSIAIHQNQNR